ncbi:MAG: hypothetical protein EBX90_08035 [Betaproteobacteria bacterium]|nr:hypothetical protein [Betaproteobacteria bacterium]
MHRRCEQSFRSLCSWADGGLSGRSVVRRERDVNRNLDALPDSDLASRQIVQAMKQDEQSHAASAEHRGASDLPKPVHWLMRASAKLMTKTAYHL